METRSRSRPKLLSSIDQIPEFFEIFLPDRNAHQLRIPPDFVKLYLDGTIPEKIILEDLSHKVWHVDLEKEGEFLFFKNGWERFVNDNSLELGEFLVFRYNRSSSGFNVRVFGKDGCKKGRTLTASDDTRFTRVKVEPDSVLDSPTPIHKRKCTEESSDPSLAARTRSRKSSEAEENVTEDRSLPRKICFVQAFVGNKGRPVHVPKRVMNKYGIKLMRDVVLCDRRGGRWRSRIDIKYDGRNLIRKGWWEFVEENDVRDGDECEFTFVLDKRRICKEFLVDIKRRMRKPTKKQP